MDRITACLQHASHPTLPLYRRAGMWLALCLCLTACSTVRNTTYHATDSTATKNTHTENALTALAQPHAAHTDFTARMATDIAYNDHVLPIKGNLRMRRGEVVQMAFTALGVVEVARVEMTPKGVWLIDRLNKQFAAATYDQLPGVTLSYNMAEALLWNELFVPGENKTASMLTKLKSQRTTDDQLLITPTTTQTLQVDFVADAEGKELRQTSLAYGPVKLTWGCEAFQTMGSERFPAVIKAVMTNGKESVSATATLTNMLFDNTEWAAHTNLNSYTEIPIGDFLQRLSFLK